MSIYVSYRIGSDLNRLGIIRERFEFLQIGADEGRHRRNPPAASSRITSSQSKDRGDVSLPALRSARPPAPAGAGRRSGGRDRFSVPPRPPRRTVEPARGAHARVGAQEPAYPLDAWQDLVVVAQLGRILSAPVGVKIDRRAHLPRRKAGESRPRLYVLQGPGRRALCVR